MHDWLQLSYVIKSVTILVSADVFKTHFLFVCCRNNVTRRCDRRLGFVLIRCAALLVQKRWCGFDLGLYGYKHVMTFKKWYLPCRSTLEWWAELYINQKCNIIIYYTVKLYFFVFIIPNWNFRTYETHKYQNIYMMTIILLFCTGFSIGLPQYHSHLSHSPCCLVKLYAPRYC